MRARILRTTILSTFIIAGLSVASCHKQETGIKAAEREWPFIGGDLGNTHFTKLDKITPANVKTLGAAWVANLGDPNAGTGRSADTVRGTAVTVNGKLFVVTSKKAFALNPKTGETIWEHELPAATYGLFKGPATGEGMIFVGLGNSHILALKQDTGEQVWEGVVGDGEVGDQEVKRGQFIAGGPTYANGIVVSGLANADYGIQGRVVAFDAKTGKRLWRFNTTPTTKDEPGNETWPWDQTDWLPGGGGVWSIPAVDPELGLVYFGVGNPIPQYGGETRAGDNLFSDSAVALDIKTGEVKWHYQVVHHDIWEADLGTPLVLYDAVVDGKPRKALAAASTYGYIYMLDRATGKPLYQIEERPVPQNQLQKTSPTQPIPVDADQIGTKCVDPASIPAGWKALCMYDPIDHTIPNAMYPIKSMRAAPMAYSPITKAFYATAADWPSWLRRFEDPKFFAAGPTAPGMKYTGVYAAMDATTNKLKWRKTDTFKVQDNGSGFMATAGGVLFHGSTDGNFEAYDPNNGELLWQFQTGASANYAPSSFQVDDDQIVTVASGGKLWAFKLGGTIPPSDTAPTPVPTETTFAGRVVDTTEVTMGPTVSDSGLEKVRQAQDEYAYLPVRIKVTTGAKVTWKNEGKESHDATASDGSWTTGPVAPGKSATVTFAKAGSYAYSDTMHPWQFGQIIVEDAE